MDSSTYCGISNIEGQDV
jgi:hypothetical protein